MTQRMICRAHAALAYRRKGSNKTYAPDLIRWSGLAGRDSDTRRSRATAVRGLKQGYGTAGWQSI